MVSLLTFNIQLLTTRLPSLPTFSAPAPMIVPVMPIIPSANADANANLLKAGNSKLETASAISPAPPPMLSVKSAAAAPSAAVADDPMGAMCNFVCSDSDDSAAFSAKLAAVSLLAANSRIFSHLSEVIL
jgi:hypothetical protein